MEKEAVKSSVSVCWGCYDRAPQPEGLKQQLQVLIQRLGYFSADISNMRHTVPCECSQLAFLHGRNCVLGGSGDFLSHSQYFLHSHVVSSGRKIHDALRVSTMFRAVVAQLTCYEFCYYYQQDNNSVSVIITKGKDNIKKWLISNSLTFFMSSFCIFVDFLLDCLVIR